ncbi:hypothetical protein [Comamonas serinivorans]|uniref:hypothetical protein n=1 Tax=Comamonas serinivorans TaxID=1082851 RepID=UPI0012F9BEE2|nr:hypothetical protein [Comamonas serinivorans]
MAGNDLWAEALAEAEDPEKRQAGLWARCFAEAGGDESKAKAAYVSARVAPETPQAVQPKKGGLWKWVIGVPAVLLIAFLGLGVVAGRSPEAKAKAETREAISYCWEDQKKKSLDPTSARLIAQVCENLEEEFLLKWGHKP